MTAETTVPKKFSVLAISYGRDLFDIKNAERQRMVACAQTVKAYHMIVFTHRRDGLRPQQEGNLFLYPTHSRSRYFMLFDAYRSGRQIMKDAPNEWVVTAQDPFEAGLVGWWLARRAGVAFNVQEHADYFSTPHWRRDSWGNRVRYLLGRFLLLRADSVRVVSERIVRTLAAFALEHKRILKLSVRTDQVIAREMARSATSQLRAQFPHDLIVLTMARLVSQKNLSLLIKAFARLVTACPQARLIIVGKGKEETQLKQLCSSLKINARVTFLPWTDTPGALMAEADIYALSSNWEGWGRVLIEAMAAGVPVVTTDVGCAGEVLKDGEHGYVVPVGDEAAFADKLTRLALDEQTRRRFGESGRQAVRDQDVGLTTYAQQWSEVLENTRNLHAH